jgi:hypothetical protein
MRDVVVRGTPTRGLAIDLGVAAARFEIERVLTRWGRRVIAGRDLSLPGWPIAPWVDAGELIAGHADWLAAQDDAAEVSAELDEAARGWPYRVAYGGVGDRRVLGRCPHEGCIKPLMGHLSAAGAFALAACDGGHELSGHTLWRAWPTLLIDLPPHRVLSPAETAVVLGVSADSVRGYVARGRIARTGDGFEIAEVLGLRAELWGDEDRAPVPVQLPNDR